MLGEACAGLRTLAQFNEDPELADDTFLLVRCSVAAQLSKRSVLSLTSLTKRGVHEDAVHHAALLLLAAQVGRMLAYSPRLVLAPGPLGTLLDTALAGLLVQHRCATIICRCL